MEKEKAQSNKTVDKEGDSQGEKGKYIFRGTGSNQTSKKRLMVWGKGSKSAPSCQEE